MKLGRLYATLVAIIALSLTASAEFLPIKVTPADGSTVDRLSKISTEWPGDWLEDYSDDVCGVVKDSKGEEVTTLTCEIDFMDPICDFYLADPVTAEGDYTVVIYAGAVQSEDEEWNEEFTLHYTIGDNVEKEPMKFVSADPEDGAILKSLEEIETIWSETIASISDDLKVVVTDSEGEIIQEMTVRKSIFSNPPTIYLSLPTPVEEDGVYKVVIPEGMLTGEDGAVSEAVELTYTVDSLSTIKETEIPSGLKIEGNKIIWSGVGEVKVYASDGTRVGLLTAPATLSLSQGNYIVIVNEGKDSSVVKLGIR